MYGHRLKGVVAHHFPLRVRALNLVYKHWCLREAQDATNQQPDPEIGNRFPVRQTRKGTGAHAYAEFESKIVWLWEGGQSGTKAKYTPFNL
jgi:hypothetical protein